MYSTKNPRKNPVTRLRIESLERRLVLAANLVGVDFDPSGVAPTNWTAADNTVSALTDLIDESGASTNIDLTVVTDGVLMNSNSTPPPSKIPMHANPLHAVDGNIYTASGGNGIVFEFSDLSPGTQYAVYHFGSDTLLTENEITIQGAGTPIVFRQSFGGNGLAVNSEFGDNTRNLVSYAEVVAASASGSITITVDRVIGEAATAAVAIAEVIVDGDFNDDGFWDCDDIDALVDEIAAMTDDPNFDLTGDGAVNLADRDTWLAEAGAINLGPNKVYLLGDATLDGAVDGPDFIRWNENKFTTGGGWCGGDFTADGAVDGQDFISWNENKFMSSAVAVIPLVEPEQALVSQAAAEQDVVELDMVARARADSLPIEGRAEHRRIPDRVAVHQETTSAQGFGEPASIALEFGWTEWES